MDKRIKKLLLKHLKYLSKGYEQTLKDPQFQRNANSNPRYLQEHKKMCYEIEFVISEVKKIEED